MRHLALLSVVTFMAAAAMAMLSQAQKPTFEVASIKPNNSGSSSSQTSIDDGRGYFSATNVTLKSIIVSCYRLLDYQLVGGPEWVNTARFDFQASADTSTLSPSISTENVKRSELMAAMIQSLLEDRFQLKIHWETRELPAFLLVVGKDGSKLQPTVEGRAGPGGLSAGSSRSNGTSAGTEMSGSGISISRLINMLSGRVDRPIIDKTNLAGTYDFTLKFAPYAASPAALDSATEPIGPSIFTAVQEQLGLKLESAKGPVEVLVIDSVSKPSEN
jgi:uncharacterized protein (TIGR03435 family)